jgi:hypothetical protein
MFKKLEKPAACEMRFVIHFLNARNMKLADIHLQLCEVNGEHAMSDSLVRNGWDISLNDAKMCMMIRGAADSLWLTKIWCVQWKRRFKRTDDSQFRHFPWNFHKFHGHFIAKFCPKNFVFGNCVLAGCRSCLRKSTKWNGRPVFFTFLTRWCDASWQCPPIHCRRNARSHRDFRLGTIRSSPPPTAQT